MSVVDTGTSSGHAPVAFSARLAKEIVNSDPSILSLIVVGKNGDVLSAERSPHLKGPVSVDPQALKDFGMITNVLLGAASKGAERLGRTEFLIVAYKENKALIVSLPEYQVTLGMRIVRSANAEYIYGAIKDILATS